METLESRLMFSATDEAQLFNYLLNRARQIPTVSTTLESSRAVDGAQPLVLDQRLNDSAAQRLFSGFAAGEGVPQIAANEAVRQTGFPLPMDWPSAENFVESTIAGARLAGGSAALDSLLNPVTAAQSVVADQLLGTSPAFAAITSMGLARHSAVGPSLEDWWTIHAAPNRLGRSSLTGVVFDDVNHNGVYDLGEGLADVTVSNGRVATKTNSAGGWSLEVPAGVHSLVVSGGAFQGDSQAFVTVTDRNVAVDFISGRSVGIVSFATWRNALASTDVDNNGHTSPLDALLLINQFNSVGSAPLDDSRLDLAESQHFIDVSGDRYLSPLDALLVINELNARGSSRYDRASTSDLLTGATFVASAQGLAESEGSVVSPVDQERLVNTLVPRLQTSEAESTAIATNAAGQTVMTFTGRGPNDTVAVFARRFNSDGAPLGDAFQVNTTVREDQKRSSVAMDAAGNFVVAWEGRGPGDQYGIFAQWFAADGSRLGSETLINSTTGGQQQDVAVAISDAGEAVFAWSGVGAGDFDGVFLRRFTASRSPQGPEQLVNSTTSNQQAFPSIGMSADGRSIVTWASKHQDGSDWGVFGQSYSATGAKVGGEFQMHESKQASQYRPSVDMADDGSFVVAWSGYQTADRSWDIFARRFDADGQPRGREYTVNRQSVGHQKDVSVAMSGGGSYVITWTSGVADGSGWEVYANVYDATDVSQEEFQVNTVVVGAGSGHQQFSAVAIGGGPRALITWSGRGVLDRSGVFRRPFESEVLQACQFASDFTNLTIVESGGSLANRGTVVDDDCGVKLTEGDSFLVGLEMSFVVPDRPTALTFTYDQLDFDTTDQGFVRDAMEVAIVDEDGNSLAAPFSLGRDAFFNVTEGLAPLAAAGVEIDDETITVGLNGIPAGIAAKAIVRLINNDRDQTTSVRLEEIRLIDSNLRTATTSQFLSSSNSSAETSRTNGSNNSVSNYPGLVASASSATGADAASRLDVPVTAAATSEFLPVLKWSWTSTNTLPTSLNVMMTPAVFDLNRDGVPEIVFGSSANTTGTNPVPGVLRALNGSDGSELFTVTDSAWSISASDSLAVGDLEGDGSTEIVAIDSSGTRVLIFESDGRPRLRSSPIEQTGLAAIALADLDHDGVSEIVIGRQVLNADGSIRWSGAGGRGGVAARYQISLVADIDDDGDQEVIAGNTAYTSTGAIKWQSPNPDGYNAIGNFDSDPLPEIVLVSGGRIWLLEHTGETKWGPVTLPGGGNGGPPTIADYDNDGLPEIGIAGALRYVVLEHDGSVKWQATIRDSSSHVTGSSVFDFDSDGNAEVIYRDETTFRIYDGRDGTVRFATPLSSCTWSENIIVADVDADGPADIVAQANNNCGFGPQQGVFVYESGSAPWSSTRPLWNQHTYHITNINDDGSIPRFEANSWEVYNNYRRNLQTTGTQLGRPLISASSPASQFPALSTTIVSGFASAQGTRSDGSPNRIELVQVNGRPVDVLDEAGRFFAAIEILPGENELTFVATDSVGQTASTTLKLLGTTGNVNPIDFSRYADITGSFSGAYFRTSFNEAAKQLHVDLATRNNGPFDADVPLLVGVKNISDPTVTLVGADGLTPEGIPFYDYTASVEGGRLAPGETTASPTVSFYNPSRRPFTYELVFYGKLNEAPVITTLPDIEALLDRPYRYDVDATDADSDSLTYSLAVAPTGMSIDATSGEITWTPAATQLGLHDVTVHVDDGRGGTAEQRFTVSAIPAPPNRPPVITSTPVTSHFGVVTRGDGFADVVLDYFAAGSSGIAEPYGGNVNPNRVLGRVEPVDPVVATGSPGLGPFTTQNVNADWLALPRGSYVTLGFTDEIVIDGPGDDIFIRSTDPFDSAGERAIVYVSDNASDFVLLGQVRQLGRQGLDLAEIGFTKPVRAIRIEGVDNLGWSPGFDLFSVEVFPNSIGSQEDYRYDVNAIDPDDDSLLYSLASNPVGMQINPTTGEIRWAPAADQLGDHSVRVSVADGRGGVAEQEFVVCVHGDPENHAPVIVSEPISTTRPGATYDYLVQALDSDSDELTYSLQTPPIDMSIDPQSGRITWIVPQAPGENIVPIKVQVVDGKGGVDIQSFNLLVEQGSGEIHGTKYESTLTVPGQAVPVLLGPTPYHSVLDSPFDVSDLGVSAFLEDFEDHLANVSGVTFTGTGVVTSLQGFPASRSDSVDGDDGDPANGTCLNCDALWANGVPGFTITFDDGVLGGLPSQVGVVWTDGFGTTTFEAFDGAGVSLGVIGPIAIGDDVATGTTAEDRFFGIDYAGGVGSIQIGNSSGGIEIDHLQFRGIVPVSKVKVPGVSDPYLAGMPNGATASSGDIAPGQSPIQVSTIAVAAGDVLSFSASGLVANGPTEPRRAPDGGPFTGHAAAAQNGIADVFAPINSLIGVFLSESNPMIGTVPTALDFRQTGNVAGGVNYESLQPMLKQPFFIGDGTTVSGTRQKIVAPPGATRLFLGTMDGQGWQNNNGEFSVAIQHHDAGLSGWTIYLDQNQNGQRDVGERFTVTDTDGDYAFTGLSPDTYIVREELRPGWSQTFPSIVGNPLPTGDGFADVVLEFFGSGSAGRAEPFGRNAGRTGNPPPETVDPAIVLGPPPPAPIIGPASTANWLTLPAGSYVTVGFQDETVINGPGNDIFIRSLDPADSAGESADIFVSSDLETFVLLGRAPQGGNVGLDLSAIGFNQPVRAVRVQGVDNRGRFPGFDLVSVEVLPGSIGPGDGSYIVVLGDGQVVTGRDFGNTRSQDMENQEPVFSGSLPTTAVVGSLFRETVQASDPDNDPITYDLPLAPIGMTVHPTLGTVVWSPTREQLGSHSVVLRAKDDRGGIALQQFTINVVNPNAAPTIVTSPPSNAAANTAFAYDVDAQDADVDTLSYRLESPLAGMSIDQGNGRFTWTPTVAQVGSRDVTVVVTDGRGGEARQTFTVVVAATGANSPPAFNSTPHLRAFAALPYGYSVSAADANGDALTFTLESGPTGMTLDGQRLLSWTPTFDQAATHTHSVRLRVSDSKGGSAVQEFTIVVGTEFTNDAPRITSNPPLVAVEGRTYVYDLLAVDPDADPLLWRLDVAPAGMSLDPQRGTLRWEPREDQLGEQSVVVSVQDITLQEDSQRFVLEVRCANTAPAIISIPQTAAVAGRTYLYALRANDLERDNVRFALTSKPSGMSIDEDTGLIRWSPTSSQIGLHNIAITATDSAGAIGRQTYSIKVSAATDPLDPSNPNSPSAGNRAPLITSTPDFTAEVDTAYAYQVTAVDPDGDSLTYAVSPTLPGMTISPTGLIEWTPSSDQAGSHALTVTVRDSNNAIATQGFLLSVETNLPPVINSTPFTTVTAGAAYRYTVRATDPERDPLTYRLETAPNGMTIDNLGRILWQSPPTDTTPQPVTVVVTDDHGHDARQSFTITTTADSEAPRVTLLIRSGDQSFAGDGQIDLGVDYIVTVSATDNVRVVDVGLLVDGQRVPLDANHSATLSATAIRTLRLEGTASDAAGLQGSTSVSLAIVDPSQNNSPVPSDPSLPTHPGFDPTDNRPPTVIITSPAPATTVTNLTPIIGTVDDPEDNLWYYRVYMSRADRVSLTGIDLDDPDWTLLRQSNQEVIDGELAVFDPSMATNDPYAIVVAAFDGNGRGYIQPTLVYVEGNVQVGNFRLEFTDLTVPLAGIPIQVTRVYDTANAEDEGDFGFGWSLGMQDARLFEVAAVGAGGAFNPGNDKFVPDKTKVYLTNPSGQRVGFTYKEQLVAASFFGGMWRPYFQPDPGVYVTLTIDETQVARGGLVGALSQGINPSFYTLTTKDGLKYRYSDTAGLQTITDLNGNVVTFTSAGITHSSGDAIQFVRDYRGRIKEIVDPSGNKLTYTYDAAGDLTRFANQLDLETRYEYLVSPAHYLDQAFDALGKRVLKAVYELNPDTRQLEYKGVIDASGNRIDSREFDTERNTGIVRDANGNATTLLYDDRGNVLTETDPLGHTTTREYGDARHPDLETRIIDRNGNITDREYDPRGNLTKIAERGSAGQPLNPPVVTEFQYDAVNRVTSIKNASGKASVFAYDAQGNLTRITNAEGNSSSFTYDNQGRRQSFTDFNGNTTVFEYDAACPCGSPSKTIFADGAYQTFRYNGYGQVIEEAFYEANGTLAEIKRTAYDLAGRVTGEQTGLVGGPSGHPYTLVLKFYQRNLLDYEAIVHPDTLNPNLTITESPATPVSQRKSRITDYEYDANDRLIRQTDANGGVVEFRYDAQGNRIALMDPVGNITTWVYDSLNRVVEERDPLYWDEVKTRDAVFASLSDFDFLNQVAPVTPGAVADPLYDDPSGVDAAQNRGAPHIRVTAYDPEGNQAETIDRNGRRREFDYDQAGRLTEERWYNEPTHATAPGALVETITFTYDTLGNMLTASDSNSNYLYTYDTLNRLRSVDNNPDGSRDVPRVILTYGYDKQGNVISTNDDAGVTVASTYNARNLLATRKWFDATPGTTPDVDNARVDFRYTAAGREAEIRRYSDLTATTLVGTTTRTYDLSGRSDSLIHRNATNSLIAGYDYDYDFAGLLIHEARTHQDPQYAQTIDYAYDLTGQLVFADFDMQDDERYVYDLNGNRITSQAGTETRTYSTGSANQLISEGTFTYEYDGEGNTILQHDVLLSQSRRFVYDHRNRLLSISTWSQSDANSTTESDAVIFINDAFSHRIVEIAGTDSDDSVKYFVHESGSVWQTIGRETASARYVNGVEPRNILLASRQNGPAWQMTDKLGTVRDSSDGAHFEFSAFGSQIIDSSGAVASTSLSRGMMDTAGFIDLEARTFSHTAGRFTSQDPIGFNGGDTNLYRYVMNSPTNGIDPTGTIAILEHAGLSASLNGMPMAFLGFFSGFSFATFTFLGHFLATGSRFAAADRLGDELVNLLLIDYSMKTSGTGLSAIKNFTNIPYINTVKAPLDIGGTFLHGMSTSGGGPSGSVLKDLEGDLAFVVSELLKAESFISGATKTPEPPMPLEPNSNAGGFINGIRMFLHLLVGNKYSGAGTGGGGGGGH